MFNKFLKSEVSTIKDELKALFTRTIRVGVQFTEAEEAMYEDAERRLNDYAKDAREMGWADVSLTLDVAKNYMEQLEPIGFLMPQLLPLINMVKVEEKCDKILSILKSAKNEIDKHETKDGE